MRDAEIVQLADTLAEAVSDAIEHYISLEDFSEPDETAFYRDITDTLRLHLRLHFARKEA